MKKSAISLVPVLLAVAPCLASQAVAADKPDNLSSAGARTAAKKPMVMAPADLKWEADPDVPGAKVSVVSGDPTQGAFAAFQKWPAGTSAPLHHHTNDAKAVGISGHVIVTMADGQVLDLCPGCYGIVPGGLKHTTACKAGAECVFYIEQPGKGDTILAAEPVKPATAPTSK